MKSLLGLHSSQGSRVSPRKNVRRKIRSTSGELLGFLEIFIVKLNLHSAPVLATSTFSASSHQWWFLMKIFGLVWIRNKRVHRSAFRMAGSQPCNGINSAKIRSVLCGPNLQSRTEASTYCQTKRSIYSCQAPPSSSPFLPNCINSQTSFAE